MMKRPALISDETVDITMLPNPTDLTFFLEVTSTLNMSRAAERLGITQPALSQSVKRLEHAFDQQLLVRGKGGVKVTKAGEKLAVQARELLEQWEKIKGEAQRDESEVRGSYALGIHPSVAIYTLSHFMPKLLQRHPALELKLVHDLSRKVTEDVVSFKVDFGIAVNPYPHPDLVIKELFEDEVIFCRGAKRRPANDLESDETVLIVEPDLTQSQTLMGKLGNKRKKFRRVITSSNLEVIKELILSGCGVGIIPSRVLGKDLKKVHNLSDKAQKGAFPHYKDRICLVYRADAQKSQASRTLIGEISQALRKS